MTQLRPGEGWYQTLVSILEEKNELMTLVCASVTCLMPGAQNQASYLAFPLPLSSRDERDLGEWGWGSALFPGLWEKARAVQAPHTLHYKGRSRAVHPRRWALCPGGAH